VEGLAEVVIADELEGMGMTEVDDEDGARELVIGEDDEGAACDEKAGEEEEG
jgi:hypothetical protein